MSEAIHEQAMERLAEATGLVPVESPTTRQLGASAEARAADSKAAFADPSIQIALANRMPDVEDPGGPFFSSKRVKYSPLQNP